MHVRHSDLWECVRDIWGHMEKSKGGVWLTGTLLNPTGSTAARRLCDTPGAGGCCGCRMGEVGDGLPCPAPRCPFDCSDQGRCRAGRCHCFEGFTGPFCATPICPPGRGGPHCTLGMSCMSPSSLLPWHLVLMPPPSILVCPPVSSAVLQCSPSVPIPVLSVVPDPSSALSVLVFPWLGHFCSLETPSVSPSPGSPVLLRPHSMGSPYPSWLGHPCSLETPSMSPNCLHPFDPLSCGVLKVSPRCGCLIP